MFFSKKGKGRKGDAEKASTEHTIPSCCDACRLHGILKNLVDEKDRELVSPFWVDPNKQPEKEWEEGEKNIMEGKLGEGLYRFFIAAIASLYQAFPNQEEYWAKCRNLLEQSQPSKITPVSTGWYEQLLSSYYIIRKERKEILDKMHKAYIEFQERFGKKQA